MMFELSQAGRTAVPAVALCLKELMCGNVGAMAACASAAGADSGQEAR